MDSVTLVFSSDAELSSICVFGLFLFQAEDGIRDLVRSRGLGDVYKRQHLRSSREIMSQIRRIIMDLSIILSPPTACRIVLPSPVSYTHLTLPTSDLV